MPTGTRIKDDVQTVVRLQVLLAKDVAEALKSFAARNHTSLTEEVRRGITLLKFFYEHVGSGNEIVIRDKSGNLREYHFIW